MEAEAELTEKIIEKAKSLGASVAGVASVDSLKDSPSHRIYPKIGMNLQVRWQDAKDGVRPAGILWPADAVSAVVIGVAHPAGQPELDWWDGKGTPGNRILMRINEELSEWIEKTFPIRTCKLPYLIEKGGIFLKDAAVMAGLGCIGRNNLVITPGFGPRIRFRALLLNREAEATGPLAFRPCDGCSQPCRNACPVKSFQHAVYSADALGQTLLPGVDGTYDRVVCNQKMQKDIEDAVMRIPATAAAHQDMRQRVDEFEGASSPISKNDQKPSVCVKYCRRCELSCPVGKQGFDKE